MKCNHMLMESELGIHSLISAIPFVVACTHYLSFTVLFLVQAYNATPTMATVTRTQSNVSNS